MEFLLLRHITTLQWLLIFSDRAMRNPVVWRVRGLSSRLPVGTAPAAALRSGQKVSAGTVLQKKMMAPSWHRLPP